ncbi:hypothetical protein PPYR_12866 [Photinus pyralis]|uniref:Nudix hydrolase domain-containing protein n=2 Tax=Photinus pyralis TaxID=7054 RepID=A0A5N4A7E0_PHOPY|nr:hypothetical protein PPYR_12866 [Photinus pyralis]
MPKLLWSFNWRHLSHRNSSMFSAENILNEENLKKVASKFANMPTIRLQTHEPSKRAAVLIPLCVVDDKVSLLYTLRAANLKSHRAQVSFPGGMFDDKDKCLEHTATRETEEELGIGEEDIRVWGRGKLIVTATDKCVLPIMGQILTDFTCKSLKINKNEVEEVFTVPLEDLCDPKFLRHTQFRGGYSMPVFLAGAHRIWGLTALITHQFLKSLALIVTYNNIVPMIPYVRNSSSKKYNS